MSEAGEEGPRSHDETTPRNEPGSVQLGPKMADQGQKQQVACVPGTKHQQKKDAARNQKASLRRSKANGAADGTHLETAVDQANVRGGDVKVPLDLSDRALHVRRRQRSREAGEGQHQNEHLQTAGRKAIHQNRSFSSQHVGKVTFQTLPPKKTLKIGVKSGAISGCAC